VLDLIGDLAERIKKDFPDAQTELETFASGSAMLDVQRDERLFVFAYSPSSGFGVDQVSESEGFNTGYRFTSNDFQSAARELYRLLRT
jgi:hypothetical protein